MAEHDNSYKLLFSHAELVADLIRGFVHEDWVEHLDFSSLEKVDGSYVAGDLRNRESDLVWRVRWGRDGWLYVYLLLEFQSTVDPHMAVRVLTYLGLLYQDLIRQRLLSPAGRLPPVLPLVLYNGHGPWRAAQEMADLVEEVPGGLERYRPSLRYFLLDEERLAEGDLELRNLAAALFRLERSRSPQDVERVLAALVDWLRGPEQAGLRQAFTAWLVRVFLPSRLPGVEVPKVIELQEVKSMLADRVTDWTRTWKEEGIQEGIQEGEQKALSSLREVVQRKLESRFGSLSVQVRQRLEATDSIESLAELLTRVNEAPSLSALGLE